MSLIALKGKHGVGKFARVDREMLDFLSQFPWRLDARGYVAFSFQCAAGYRCVYMHQAVMGKVEGMHIDHINHDPLDNRTANLRICTVAENIQNSVKKALPRSGYRGVTWHYTMKRWRARIRVAGKQLLIGYYDTAEEAAKAHDEYRANYVPHVKEDEK